MTKTVAFTGHRPNKLGGYTWNKSFVALYKKEIAFLIEEGYNTFISGGAMGIDMYAWQAVHELQKHKEYSFIKNILYIPCPEQANKWSREYQEYHKYMVKNSNHVQIIESKYSITCMNARNKAMINKANLLVAYWNGSGGGTRNAINYAHKKNVQVVNLYKSPYKKQNLVELDTLIEPVQLNEISPYFSNIGQTSLKDENETTGFIYESDSFSNDLILEFYLKLVSNKKVISEKSIIRNMETTPIYYNEKKEDIMKYNALGYLNIEKIAKAKNNTIKTQFLKSGYKLNSHTQIFIFVVSKFKKETWEFIRNCLTNGKTVNITVPEENKKIVNLQENSKEYRYLARRFTWRSEEAKRYYKYKRIQENDSILNTKQVKSWTSAQKRIVQVLSNLYELEQPKTNKEYVINWNACKAYIQVGEPFKRINENSNIDILPMHMYINNIKYCLVKLIRFTPGVIEFFGDMDIVQEQNTRG